MAAFRGFSRKGNLGDLKSEVALLRADLNSLNDELGYLLRNLGTDNMNPAELAASSRSCLKKSTAKPKRRNGSTLPPTESKVR